jgi:hypothetical protein
VFRPVHRVWIAVLAIAVLVTGSVVSAVRAADAAQAGPDPASPGYATVTSFAPDLLGGDNGLPTSPDLPPPAYGPISTPVDAGGDALDAHEGQYLGYFDGSYYLYGTEYGCGTHIDLSDNAPFCGFVTDRSADLVHWRRVDRFFTGQLRQVCAAYCAFPKVVYNPRRHRYLMYFSSDNGGNLGSKVPSSRWLAESASPAGPWSDLRRPDLLHGDSDSYGLAAGPDGEAYMFELHDAGGLSTQVWVEPLNAEGTGSSGTATLIATGPYSNVSAFRHGGAAYPGE